MKYPVYTISLIALAFALLTGLLLPAGVVEMSSVTHFSHYVASVVPGVSIMARHAIDPGRAELTWAVQWLFSPLYLIIMLVKYLPFKDSVKLMAVKRTLEVWKSGRDRIQAAHLGAFILSLMILADFNVIHSGSFFRGTVFDGMPPSTMSAVLRAPFTSNIGMVIYAWFIPFCNAGLYFGFLSYVVNFNIYFKNKDDLEKLLSAMQSKIG